MKTLITISNPELKKLIFSGHQTLERLSAISEIDWVEEGRPFTPEELNKRLPDYDACITSWGSPKLTAEILQNATRLKFVGHAAGTVVPVVDESIFEREITVVNANTSLARSTAELTVALMMNLSWKLNEYNLKLKEGQWSNNAGETVPGLFRQAIGLIGFGEISKEVIRLLKPFEPRILLYSQYCTAAEAAEAGVELCSLDELLQSSKIISLHSTLSSKTAGLLQKRELDLISDGALLINTARGPIIDETALMDTLTSGRLFAALDVYHHEPVLKDNPLLHLPNVFCVPHIGGFSSYWKTRLGLLVVEDMERWLQGKELHGQMTLEKFRRLSPK